MGTNQLAPPSTVVITQVSPGTSTTPAINIIRLALAPVADNATWTSAGSPSYALTGSLVPNPVALEELMGTFLTFTLSLMIQVTTGSDVETLASIPMTIDNTLLPVGSSPPTPPTPPPGSFTMTQDLALNAFTVTFNYSSRGFANPPTNIIPTLVKSDGTKVNISIYPRIWTATSITCDLSSPTDDTTYVASILVIP